MLDENLKIIQQIFCKAIEVDNNCNSNITVEYYTASKKISVNIEYQGNSNFYDGLTRSWRVSVNNTELLKVVLEDIERIQNNPEDDFLL